MCNFCKFSGYYDMVYGTPKLKFQLPIWINLKFFIYLFSGLGGKKKSACNAGDLGSTPGLGRSPGEGNATHSSILAWKIPWTAEPGGLQSVKFSYSAVSDSLQPHEPQHTRPPWPSPIPGVYPNPRPSSRWCHPTISSSVIPFSSCFQSFPASGSFQMSQLIASGGQSIGVSASNQSFQWIFRTDFL